MDKDFVIGVDASTTAIKAIVWDLKGGLVAEGRADIPLLRPRLNWHEQAAEEWWRALRTSLRIALTSVNPDRLSSICICPQRETFVPINEEGQPLRNAILWMDVRARSLIPAFESHIGSCRFHDLTGKPLAGNLTAMKILWMRENEPKAFHQTRKFLDVAAYLNYHLTGEFVTGWGIGDPTGLFDIRNYSWSQEILEFLQINVDHLPQIYPAGTVIGRINKNAARECRLPVDLPVIAGLGDGQAGGLGVNVTRSGECYLSLGTSVVSGTLTEKYCINRSFRTMIAGKPGAYSLETVILGGTYTIDWFMEKFAPGLSIDQLEGQAGTLKAGAGGLMLVPYWNSVLNPYWDSSASGIALGWRGHHGPTHLYRALLEGIAFELRLHFEGVESALKREIGRLVVMGGGSKSDVWCQIIADITGKTISRAITSEAVALGAGMIAACGSAAFDGIPIAAGAMSGGIQDQFFPDMNMFREYSKLYEDVYREIFPALQNTLSRLTAITGKE